MKRKKSTNIVCPAKQLVHYSRSPAQQSHCWNYKKRRETAACTMSQASVVFSTMAFSFLSAMLFCFFAATQAHEPQEYIGWNGEGNRAEAVGRRDERFSNRRSDLSSGLSPITIDPSKVIQLSWQPRAFLYKGFLTHEECDHIISLADPQVKRSLVANNADGSSELSEVRTSSGTFLEKFQDKIVKGVEERIAAWTFLPVENGEGLQVLRYNLGQKYSAHYDYFHDKTNRKFGGHRLATVLMYLSDVELGGETVFPNAPDPSPKDSSWSDCAKQGLAVKPVKGDAILFFSLNPDATPDTYSMHTSCPVIKGVKWSAAKWIHVAPINKLYDDPNHCEDADPRCNDWAFEGECSKNSAFMVGDGRTQGHCLKSCNACPKAIR